MNFLAHVFLSEDIPKVTMGNFIADSLPNNKFQHFSDGIQIGILLHRSIDHFTDTHPIVRKSKKRLFEKYRHFSSVIVDIFYDHFLAKNWAKYSKTPLNIYVENFYQLLEDNFDELPQETQQFLPYMVKNNWLLSYATLEGISTILVQMNRRTRNRSKMNFAIYELETFYEQFENEFSEFFEELKTFAHQRLISLLEEYNYEEHIP
jgi:acyl carrier protein phosphodiesterase